MAGIDKAAIIFSIAITIVGAGIAVAGNAADNAPAYTAPAVTKEMPKSETQNESFGADISEKVKAEDNMMEKETVKIEEEMVMEEEMIMEETMVEEATVMEETHEKPTGPTTHTVDIPEGTAVPGCEESNACYLPADITINAGDTIEWINVDTAAHTVTGGSPAEGPSGVFDSSLVMVNANYSFTFDDAGSYDYFCMVHPWMLGSVTVN